MMRFLVVSCLALVLAVPSRAGGPKHDAAGRWTRRLEAIDASLKASDWSGSESSLAALQAEVLDDLVGGPGEARLLGLILIQRSVARAGSGDRDGAEYWWWSAQQIWPEASAFDLERFGDVGLAVRDLGAPPPRAQGSAPEPGTIRLATGETMPVEDVVLPKLVDRPPPLFPRGKLKARPAPAADTAVEVIVDAQGRTTRPRILEQGEPGFTVASLDALSRWRYEPARVGGEPRAVFLLVRVNHALDVSSAPFSATPGSTMASVHADPEPVQISGAIVPPKLIRREAPAYPPGTPRGEVVLQGVVEVTGEVSRLQVLKSLSPGADRAAIRAASHWRYQPATLEGKPQAVYLVIRLSFAPPPPR